MNWDWTSLVKFDYEFRYAMAGAYFVLGVIFLIKGWLDR